MISTVRDDYTEKFHQDEVQIRMEKLAHEGYHIIETKRISKMFLLWGENITEIYCSRNVNDKK